MYQIIKSYKDDGQLRHSFNELAIKTFNINFEEWYKNGYWTDKYNPYSIAIDGKVVANVSVNTTIFKINGQNKKYIQLGTVMTEKQYRNKGLIREIMKEIDNDYINKVDGMYLFASNDVLSFYPKFGFQAAKQYEYFKTIEDSVQQFFVKVPIDSKKYLHIIESKIKNCYIQSAFEMVDNSELNMFYILKHMKNNVFYSKEMDTYVIAEINKDTLIIDMVISDREQDLNKIANGFGKAIRNVKLGFTPKNIQGFKIREMNQDDRTLHIKGDLKVVEEYKLMFPLLSHA